jgi:hypothetical protein
MKMKEAVIRRTTVIEARLYFMENIVVVASIFNL